MLNAFGIITRKSWCFNNQSGRSFSRIKFFPYSSKSLIWPCIKDLIEFYSKPYCVQKLWVKNKKFFRFKYDEVYWINIIDMPREFPSITFIEKVNAKKIVYLNIRLIDYCLQTNTKRGTHLWIFSQNKISYKTIFHGEIKNKKTFYFLFHKRNPISWGNFVFYVLFDTKKYLSGKLFSQINMSAWN